MYCGRTFGFKSCVSSAHLQISTAKKYLQLQGPEKQCFVSENFLLSVEICWDNWTTSHFCYEMGHLYHGELLVITRGYI